MSRAFGALCLILGLTAAASLWADDTWLRIDRPDAELRARLPAEAIDYGRFVWVPESALPAADRRAARAHAVSDPFALPLGRDRIDLARQPPEAPRRGPGQSAEPDFHLVQFRGPLQPDWLDTLRLRGLQPVQAIAPFGYLVWGRAEQLPEPTGRAVDPVRFAGPLPAALGLPAHSRVVGETHSFSRALIHAPSAESTIAALIAAGAQVRSLRSIGGDLDVVDLLAPPDLYPTLMSVPGVLTVQQISQDTGPRGEMSNQSVVRPYQPGQTLPPGYADWLTEVGLDGSGVVVAVVDGGIRRTHLDLADRFLPCIAGDDMPSSCSSSNDNHGTHVAGAIAGTGASGATRSGFLSGQGVAPGARLVEQRYGSLLGSSGPGGMVPGGMLTIFAESALSGALLANNSWGPGDTPRGYDIPTREVDLITRNARPGAGPALPVLPVWSIMNGSGDSVGDCAPSSLGSPDEAKNVLAVGSTDLQNNTGDQLGNILHISLNSAHGPACDGRRVPHIVAPGCRTDSTTAGSDTSHGMACGTSMASPVVSGAAALFIEQYRNQSGGLNPSPALIKARLTASARDLVGSFDADDGILGHRPDRKQGWGRLDMDNVIRPGLSVFMLDQNRVFTSTGQAWTGRFEPADPDRPVEIMLAWTDAPGHGLGGALPAWVNDLDLIVRVDEDWYYGNAFGADGFSTASGGPDGMNNLEGVVLGAHQHDSRPFRIEVLAANLAADALDPWHPGDPAQDFALVCSNCEQAPDFTLDIAPQAIRACTLDTEPGSQITVRTLLGFDDTVSLQAQALDGFDGDLSLGVTASQPPFVTTLSISPGSSGAYRIFIEAEASDLGSIGTMLRVDLAEPLTQAPASILPAADAPASPATGFSWTPLLAADQYRFELALDPGFQTVLEDRLLEQADWQPQRWLTPGQQYFWRVRGINACGEGVVSETFALEVGAGPASTVRFANQPEPDEQGFLDPIIVEVLGMNDDLITDNASFIELDIADGPPGISLEGTVIRQVANGLATFDDLRISADVDGQFQLRARLNADEALPLNGFSIVSGQTVLRSAAAGLTSSADVTGLGFAGTVSGITGNSSWASDLRLVATAPDGQSISLGGTDSDSDERWDFDGQISDNDGPYGSSHPSVFVDSGGAVSDEGFWQFAFSNDFTGGQAMSWSDVAVTLIKQPIEALSEPRPLRGSRIFSDRFESD